MYNPALEKLRNQAEQRLHQRRMQQLAQWQEQTSMRSLFDPLLNKKARERIGGDNWFETTARGYAELFDSNYIEWFRNPGNALINTLTTIGDTLDYAANLVKAPLLAAVKGEDVGTRLEDAYGLGDKGRITQNMSELREVIGAPTSGVLGGTAAGALIGTSIAPGLGTLIGAGVGLAVGGAAGTLGYYDVDIANSLVDMTLEYSVDPTNVVSAVKAMNIVKGAAKSSVSSVDDIIKASPELFGKAISRQGDDVARMTTAQKAVYEFANGARDNLDAATIKQAISDGLAQEFKNVDTTVEYLYTFKNHMDGARQHLEYLKSIPNADPAEVARTAKELEISQKIYNELSSRYKQYRGVHKNWEIERKIPIEQRKARTVKQYNRHQKNLFKDYYTGDYESFVKHIAEAGFYKSYSGISDIKLKHMFDQLHSDAAKKMSDKLILFLDDTDQTLSKIALTATAPGTLAVAITKVLKMAKYMRTSDWHFKRASEKLYDDIKSNDSKPVQPKLLKETDQSDSQNWSGPYGIVPRGVTPNIPPRQARPYNTADIKAKADPVKDSASTKPDFANMTSVERSNYYYAKKAELANIPEHTPEYYIKVGEINQIPIGDFSVTIKSFNSNMNFLLRKVTSVENGEAGIEQLASSPDIKRAFNEAMQFALYSDKIGKDIFFDFISRPTYNKGLYKKIKEVYGDEAADLLVSRASGDGSSALMGTLFSYLIMQYKQGSPEYQYKKTLNRLAGTIKSKRTSTIKSEQLVREKYQELADALKDKFKQVDSPSAEDTIEYYKIQKQLAAKNKDALLASEYAKSLQPEIDACCAAEKTLIKRRANLTTGMDYFVRGYNKDLNPKKDMFTIDASHLDAAEQYFTAIRQNKMRHAMELKEFDTVNEEALAVVKYVTRQLEAEGMDIRSALNTGIHTTFANPDSYAAKLYRVIAFARTQIKKTENYIEQFNEKYNLQLDFYNKHKTEYIKYANSFTNFIDFANEIDSYITSLNRSKEVYPIVKEVFNYIMFGTPENSLKYVTGDFLEFIKSCKLSKSFLLQHAEIISELSRIEPIYVGNNLCRVFKSILRQFQGVMDYKKPFYIYNTINSVRTILDPQQKFKKPIIDMIVDMFGKELYLELEQQIVKTYQLFEDVGKCLMDNYPLSPANIKEIPIFKKTLYNFKKEALKLNENYAMHSSLIYLEKATTEALIHKYNGKVIKDVLDMVSFVRKASDEYGVEYVNPILANIIGLLKEKLITVDTKLINALESTETLDPRSINIFINDGVTTIKYLTVVQSIINNKGFNLLVSAYRAKLITASRALVNNATPEAYLIHKLALGDAYDEVKIYMNKFISRLLTGIKENGPAAVSITDADLLDVWKFDYKLVEFSSKKYFREAPIYDYNSLNLAKLDVSAIRCVAPYGDSTVSRALPPELYDLRIDKCAVADIETDISNDTTVQIAYKDRTGSYSLVCYSPDYKTYGYDQLLDPKYVNGEMAMAYNKEGFINFEHGLANTVEWVDATGQRYIMFRDEQSEYKYLGELFRPNVQTINNKNYIIFLGQNNTNFDAKYFVRHLNKYTDLNLAEVITLDLLPAIRSYTAVGSVFGGTVASYFKNLSNAKQEEVFNALVQNGAITLKGPITAHNAADDIKMTEEIARVMFGAGYNSLGDAVKYINGHIDEFNNYWIDKMMSLINDGSNESIIYLLDNLGDATFAEDRLLRNLDHLRDITHEYMVKDINKAMKYIYNFLDEVSSIAKNVQLSFVNGASSSGQYDAPHITDNMQKLFDKCDELEKYMNTYLQQRNDILKMQYGDAMVQPRRNLFATLMDNLQTYYKFRNNVDALELRKILAGQPIKEHNSVLTNIVDKYVQQFKGTAQFNEFHNGISTFYNYQDRIDTFFYFMKDMYKFYDLAIAKSSKDELALDKVHMAFNTIHTALYGSSKTNLSMDTKMLRVINRCSSATDIQNIKDELSEVISLEVDESLNRAVEIIDQSGKMSTLIHNYINDCINNIDKYNIFATGNKYRTILRPVLSSEWISHYYNHINGIIGVMKDVVQWKPGKPNYEIDEAVNILTNLRDTARESLVNAANINREFRIMGEIPAGLVASMMHKNIYDFNNSAYDISFTRTNYAEDINTINSVEKLILEQFERDFKGMADVIEYQPALSRGKTLIRELFLSGGVSLNEIAIITRQFRLEKELTIKIFSEMLDMLSPESAEKVQELFENYRNYLIDEQRLDVDLMNKFNSYLRAIVAATILAKDQPVHRVIDDIMSPVYNIQAMGRTDGFNDTFQAVFGNIKEKAKRTESNFNANGLKYYPEYIESYNKIYDDLIGRFRFKKDVDLAAEAGRQAARACAYQQLYNNSLGVSIESDASKFINKYRFNPDIDPALKEAFEREFKAEYDDFVTRHNERANFYANLEAEREAANKAKADAFKKHYNEEYRGKQSNYTATDSTRQTYEDSYNQNFTFYNEKYEDAKRGYEDAKHRRFEENKKKRIDDYIERLLNNNTDVETGAIKSLREYKLQIIALFTDQFGHVNWDALYNYVNKTNGLDFVIMYKSGDYRNRFTKKTNAELHNVHIRNAEELQKFMTDTSNMYEFSIMDKTTILDIRSMIGHTGNNRYYKSNLLNNLVVARKFISYYIMSPLKQFSLYNIGFTVTNALEGFIKTAIESGGNPVAIVRHYQTAMKLHKEYMEFSKAMVDVLEGSPFWRVKDHIKVLQYEEALGKMLFKNWEELAKQADVKPDVRSLDEIKELISLHGSSINLPNYIKANMIKGIQRGNINFTDYAKRYNRVCNFIADELPKHNVTDYYFVNDFINSSASASDFQNIIMAEDLERTGEKAKGVKKLYKTYLFSDNWLGKRNPLRAVTPYANLSRNSNIETINRLALYLSHGEQGLYKSEALLNVLTTHFNYGNKSQSEMAAELLFPFISYPIRNFTYWMKALMEHPALLKSFIDFTMSNWGDEKDNVYNQTKITKGGIRLWNDVSVESGFSGYEALAFGGNTLNVLTQRKLNPLVGVAVEGAKQLTVGESNLQYRLGRLPIISHVQAGTNLVDNLIKGQPKIYDIAPSLFNEVYKNNRYYYANQGRYAYKSAYNRLYYASGGRRTGINRTRNMVR